MNNTAKRKKFEHLNLFELELIERMLKERKTISEISMILGRSKSLVLKDVVTKIINKLIRKFLYKKLISLNSLLINNYPRKLFNYKSLTIMFF